MARNFSPDLYADETQVMKALLAGFSWDERRAASVQAQAAELVRKIRARKTQFGQLETFLQQYSLDTPEGLALMTLAEALLRIPDKDTANALIRDKMAAADWLGGAGEGGNWAVKAAGVGLALTRKTLDSSLGGVGAGVIRETMVRALRIMGQQFVLGEDIAEALKKSRDYHKKGYRFSYDMLGEGARTMHDAERYYKAYENAIIEIGKAAKETKGRNSGISIKLSALHPRYRFAQQERCVPDLVEKLGALAKLAAERDMSLTVDAEEVERLDISLDIIEGVLSAHNFGGWEGFGLAIQAYQKRCSKLIDYLAELSQTHKRRLEVRLVKGAYWDTEIKRAQVMGYPDFPVFSRKANTDVSYLACAEKLFSAHDRFYLMFGTHNAHTASAILELAGTSGARFEFQRLHGMAETLHDILLEERHVGSCIYAPVGPHEDLLAYLVRRLLENGANSSFVNKLLDPGVPIDTIVSDPVAKVRAYNDNIRHPAIPLSRDLYRGEKPSGRANSRGIDLNDAPRVEKLLRNIENLKNPYVVAPLIDGKIHKDGEAQDIRNPADTADVVGQVYPAGEDLIEKAFTSAGEGFREWSRLDADTRAQKIERFADLMEENTEELMMLLTREAGKTHADSIAEIREAVDFCRYYANLGRRDFSAAGHVMPGPTGESNVLTLHGRGVFVCISPWNFPLAIFTGQCVAALMAGNAIIAKPASPTPAIALRAVQLMHAAGIPGNVANFMPGSGRMGGAMVAHKDTAGVVFTGSTEVAWSINRALAAKDGPIVPLIAETGGQNAMIVDSSALPEQVVDDVLLSAFGSAGQRCSALRVLCLQEDIADKVIAMIGGAMKELKVGDPMYLSSDVGPVIDANAERELSAHRQKLDGFARHICTAKLEGTAGGSGHFFPPCAYELENLSRLEREVFGPILHIVRYKRSERDKLVDELNGKGYGLTFGVHSRIESFQKDLAVRMAVGNVYVNRSMIGAVVGVQPFGGQGLSGTGPKAGGPHYLHRFAVEKVVSIDTTAAGGNASLVSIEE
jgi:RHH-type proline utilization regulon transcriptional repressor/proline dehydrogenase/delta 1-pyrroline-5-carboxylate dehydrogenase